MTTSVTIPPAKETIHQDIHDTEMFLVNVSHGPQYLVYFHNWNGFNFVEIVILM